MKGIVIYKGKYGATRQYAHWLGEELGLQVKSAETVNEKEAGGFDYLLLGSSVYIGKLQLEAWLSKNEEILTGKKIYFFLVAGTPASETEKLMSYIRKGVPELLFPFCEYYFMPGRLDMRVISWKDKFMLRMGARLAKDPADRVNMLTPYDNVRKDNLVTLLEDVRRFRVEKMVV